MLRSVSCYKRMRILLLYRAQNKALASMDEVHFYGDVLRELITTRRELAKRSETGCIYLRKIHVCNRFPAAMLL